METTGYATALEAFIDMENAMQNGDVARFEASRQKMRDAANKDNAVSFDENDNGLPPLGSPSFASRLRQYVRAYRSTITDNDPQSPEKACRKDNKTFQRTEAQERVRVFFSKDTPYRSLLLLHQTGTGKTCTAVTVMESLRDIVPTFVSKTHVGQIDRRPLVLLPAHLKNNFVDNLLDVSKLEFKQDRLVSDITQQCLGNKYLKMIPDRFEIGPLSLRRKLTRLITERFYKVMSYVEFANHLEKMEVTIRRIEPDPLRRDLAFQNKIRTLFSDRVIVIDEIHNLRLNTNDPDHKKVPPRIVQLLSYTENVRLLMMSATPMYNNAKEILFVSNLMLLNEKRTPLEMDDVFNADGSFVQDGARKLFDAMYGRVSYVSYQDPFSFPFKLFPTSDVKLLRVAPTRDILGKPLKSSERIDLKTLPLIASPVPSKFVYLFNSLKKRFGDDDDELEIHADLHVGLQLSNTIYPGTTLDHLKSGYGQNGFARCFTTSVRAGQTCVSYAPGVPTFLDEDHISTFAPKIATIVERIMSSKGVALVYGAYVLTGVLGVAVALEHRGFSRYKYGNTLIGASSNKLSQSYIMLTGDKTMCSPMSDFDDAKSPANVDGSLIKVILCSRKGSEGLDMKFIREVHVLDPWYNLNRLEQVIGRARRKCSHALLPPKQRNATVYLHAAVYGTNESIDVRIYHLAQSKQVHIDAAYKVLQDASIETIIGDSDRGKEEQFIQESSQGKHVTVTAVVRSPTQPASESSSDIIVDANLIDGLANTISETMPRDSSYVSIQYIANAINMTERSAAKVMEHIIAYRPDVGIVRAGNYYSLNHSAPVRRLEDASFQYMLESMQSQSDGSVIFRDLLDRISDVQSRYNGPLEKLREAIAGMLVDRLEYRDLKSLIGYVLTVATDDARMIIQSLEDGDTLSPDHVYMVYDNSYFKLNSKTMIFEDVSVADASSVSQFQASAKDVRDVVAVISRVTRHGRAFKIMGDDGSEALCVGHKTLSSDDMRKIISSADLTIKEPLPKQVMCEAMEIALRMMGRVLRPGTLSLRAAL